MICVLTQMDNILFSKKFFSLGLQLCYFLFYFFIQICNFQTLWLKMLTLFLQTFVPIQNVSIKFLSAILFNFLGTLPVFWIDFPSYDV